MILALTIGVLVAGAVYLLLQEDRLRVILGFVLLSHAVNLLLFSAGGIDSREEPLGEALDPATTADPLPQAFVLTAIVIAFAITIYLLVLAVTGNPSEDAGLEDAGVDDAGPDDAKAAAPAPTRGGRR
ncbi:MULTISPECIES: sodium:proton antiporter [Microbacterium]|uniref:Sodium:proton antiporter n=1 Tax=Microbacterium plantarum TaxID=1816425 RepID=A0ABV5EN66_9MICO|nr:MULTISPECIES: cation:proton antiporter subunit C [Microbacterium]MCZ4068599.1 cation:proton antiporter subunit C [Microbacterium sp. H37-C3]MDF2917476.1 cation:proton antiporter [Microbacterium sp.]RAZ30506.1 cation:proton antiporter [Microbacterium sp. SMR1]